MFPRSQLIVKEVMLRTDPHNRMDIIACIGILHILPKDPDSATRCGGQACDDVVKRCFSCAIVPQKPEDFAAVHLKMDVGQGLLAASAVALQPNIHSSINKTNP